jgi:hypothetical protein
VDQADGMPVTGETIMTLETKSKLRRGLLKLSNAAYNLDNFNFKEARQDLLAANAALQQVATIEEMNGKPDVEDNEVSEQGC